MTENQFKYILFGATGFLGSSIFVWLLYGLVWKVMEWWTG